MRALVVCCTILVFVAGCQPDVDGDAGPSGGEPWFEDALAASGVDFVHQSDTEIRYWFPEIAASGAGLIDYDGDGRLDLYLVQSGDLDPSVTGRPVNRLYRNRGGLRFEDVTALAGVGDDGYGHGCAVGDYDADGDDDLYVTNVGANVLYRNNGDGTFTDATTAAGVGDASWSTSAAFLDYDGDGHLDLFVTNYVVWSIESDLTCTASTGRRDYCSPLNYNAPAPDRLYRSNGDGTFTDVTERSGIIGAFGNGLGVTCGDFDGNGHLDIYVANDGMPNQLWLNGGDGTFSDEALLAGCAVNAQGSAEAGMGAVTVDVEHDGDLDLFLSHLNNESNTFYRNQGAWFEDATALVGLTTASVPFTGFGVGFADFDHDGRLDVYVANGRVAFIDPPLDAMDVYAEPNQLFRGDGDRFSELLPRGGTRPALVATSRAAAFGDLDDDGDVDIVVANKDGPPHLLRNVAGDDGNWIMFDVRERDGRPALYAVVEIETGGQVQRRLVQRAYSYCASNDQRVHFGLGARARVERVTVEWADGATSSFGPYDADATYSIEREP